MRDYHHSNHAGRVVENSNAEFDIVFWTSMGMNAPSNPQPLLISIRQRPAARQSAMPRCCQAHLIFPPHPAACKAPRPPPPFPAANQCLSSAVECHTAPPVADSCFQSVPPRPVRCFDRSGTPRPGIGKTVQTAIHLLSEITVLVPP